jgi:hypothetical protein
VVERPKDENALHMPECSAANWERKGSNHEMLGNYERMIFNALRKARNWDMYKSYWEAKCAALRRGLSDMDMGLPYVLFTKGILTKWVQDSKKDA